MIPFNIPCTTGEEIKYIQQAINAGHVSGNGHYGNLCKSLVEEYFGFENIFLTPSGTVALEMAALLCSFKPGDEVIIPSYTHVSTANAFIKAGATIKFADCLSGHPNLNPESVLQMINPYTKAIVMVHYAGMACDCKLFKKIAQEHKLVLIEDAAHALGASYNDEWLGLQGDFAAFSFHETKNINCGHGGMLLVNSSGSYNQAMEMWHHGTDRHQFEKGEIQYYTWVRPGGAFQLPDLNAAFLYPQLNKIREVNEKRMERWMQYYHALIPLEKYGLFRVPLVAGYAHHNAHIFYLLSVTMAVRDNLLAYLKQKNIQGVFHYVPLHTSPFALNNLPVQFLPNADKMGACLLRLPLYHSISIDTVKMICDIIKQWAMNYNEAKKL